MRSTRKFLLSAGRCLLLFLSVVATGILSLPSPCLAAPSGLHVVATTFPIYLLTSAVAQGRPGVRECKEVDVVRAALEAYLDANEK